MQYNGILFCDLNHIEYDVLMLIRYIIYIIIYKHNILLCLNKKAL